MEIGGVALRDVIIVASGLAGVYLVIMLLRLMQIGRHKPAVPVEFDAPVVPPTPPPEEEAIWPPAPPAVPPAPADEGGEPAHFGAELMRSHMEREIKQLRGELAALRDELAELKAARHVSPQYADAMAMAQRGLTAQDVADRCNISLGEAELVWALAHGQKKTNEEDDYGGEPGRNRTRSA